MCQNTTADFKAWLWFSLCQFTFPQMFQVGKDSACNAGDPRSDPWVRKIPWRREWQLTSVSLPGEFHGQRSRTGFSPWGCKELDTTERLTLSLRCFNYKCPDNKGLREVANVHRPVARLPLLRNTQDVLSDI